MSCPGPDLNIERIHCLTVTAYKTVGINLKNIKGAKQSLYRPVLLPDTVSAASVRKWFGIAIIEGHIWLKYCLWVNKESAVVLWKMSLTDHRWFILPAKVVV